MGIGEEFEQVIWACSKTGIKDPGLSLFPAIISFNLGKLFPP